MKVKLHPHLKHFILEVVLGQISTNPNSLTWKKELVKDLQTSILESLEGEITKESLAEAVDNQIELYIKEIHSDLFFMKTVLKDLPLEILNKCKV